MAEHYETEVTCPVCDKLLTKILHQEKNADINDSITRAWSEHLQQSMSCSRDPRCMRGVYCEVFFIEEIPVRTDVPFRPRFGGPL